MKSNVIVAIVFLLLGIVLGAFSAPKIASLVQRQELASLSKQANVSFDRCAGLDARASQSCADSIVIEEALRKQDRTLCASVKDESMQKDCTTRVDRIIALGDSASWCKGSSTGFCVDIATLFRATESHDISVCNKINHPVLIQSCTNVIAGNTANDAATGGARAIPITYQFGFQCDEHITDCVKDKMTLNAAIKSADVKLCEDFRGPQDLCKQEVITYAAFTSGKSAGCESAPNPVICKYDFVLAKALEAADPKLCTSLEEKAVKVCQDFVSTTKEKRFDYLNQVL